MAETGFPNTRGNVTSELIGALDKGRQFTVGVGGVATECGLGLKQRVDLGKIARRKPIEV